MNSKSAPTRARPARWVGLIRLRLVAAVSAAHAPPRRTTRRRSAAVALIVGVVVAAGAQLSLGWAASTDRLPLRDPAYADKLALLRALPAFTSSAPAADRPFTLLFLGSSRSVDGIDAGAIGRGLTERLGRRVEAFNFAQPGAGPVTNAMYLRRLLRDGVKPDAVAVEVHPALLAALPRPPEAAWFAPIRLRPEEVPLVRRLGLDPEPPAAHGYRGWLESWYVYRVPLIDRYATQLTVFPYPMASRQPCDEHGFFRCRSVIPIERSRLLELTRKQYEGCMPGYRPGGSGVAGLRDTLEICRGAGIRAALLLTPESSEFRSWYPEPGRSEIKPVLTALAGECGAALVDGREWLPDELVGDGHHLTGPGADAFSARLTNEALAPWLAASIGGGP
jgi:hypothetical protein